MTASGESERVLLKDATSVKVGWAEATQDRHFNGNPLGIMRAADVTDRDNAIAATPHPAAIAGATWGASGVMPNIQSRKQDKWEIVYQTGDGSPVVMLRPYGRGMIVADMSGLYHAAIGQQKPGLGAMRRLIEHMSTGKQVAAVKGGGGWQFSDGYRWELTETTDDGLRIHHNDVGEFSHLVAQLVPLLLCPLEAQRLFVPCHPRVDDVFDREEIRRTHQYLVFAGCHFFFYFLGKTKREPVARFPSRDNALSKF